MPHFEPLTETFRPRAVPAAAPVRDAEAEALLSLGVRRANWAAFRHRQIQRRAYRLWEEAGRPGGDGVRFWVEAEHYWDTLYGQYAPGEQ